MEENLDPEINGSSPVLSENASNINSTEIDSETASKLRGDAIGDTMYSEVFVLKTLMQFSDLKWCTETETDLCVLWDMTEEKDICEYLFKSSYPSIACSAILKCNENNRFIEIAIGILANLLCSNHKSTKKIIEVMSEEEIQTILDILESDDALILIQVMRFLHALVYASCEDLRFLTNETVEKIHFILINSTNKQLVLQTLKTLSSLTEDFKIDEDLINPELFKGAITGYQQLVNAKTLESTDQFEDNGDEEENARNVHFATKHFIEVVCNICTYIDNSKRGNEWKLDFQKYVPDFINETISILQRFSMNSEDLIPISSDFKFYLEAFCYISRVLNVAYNEKLFQIITKIVSCVISSDSGNLQHPSELFCYLITVGDSNQVLSDLGKILSNEEAGVVLKTISKNKFKFEFEYLGKIDDLLQFEIN